MCTYLHAWRRPHLASKIYSLFRCVYSCQPQFSLFFYQAKRSFNRAVNSILSKLLGVASEEVIFHLIKVKCLPILLYGTDVCELNASVLSSLDFCVVRFGMKIFGTANRQLILDCFRYMGFDLPSALVPMRVIKFRTKMISNLNIYCQCALSVA